MAGDLVISRIVAAVGVAASRAFASYYRSRQIRDLAWRAEYRQALSFVTPEDWDELDLDVLIERAHRAKDLSYPAALGRQLWVVLDVAKSPEITLEAHRALDIAQDTPSETSELGVTATVESLQNLARPLVRYAPAEQVRRLLQHAQELNPASAESLAERIEHVSRQVGSQTPYVRTPERELEAKLWAKGGIPIEGTVHVANLGDGNPVPLATGTHVNVGLVEGYRPRRRIETATLQPDTLYWLWIGVGPRPDDALAGRSDPIDSEALGGATEVDVALFPDEELIVFPTPPWGTLAVSVEGAFPVIRPAAELTIADVGEAAHERLYFSVRTPHKPGSYRLRCGVFVRGLLIHVEQVALPVGAGTGQLSASTTFRMARELTPQTLDKVAEHRLSVYVNANDDDSHSFAFFGREGEQRYADTVNLDGNQIRVMLGEARRALQAVSWLGGGEYKKGRVSQYEPISPGAPFATPTKLETDLVKLAVAGRRLWLEFAGKLTGGVPKLNLEFQHLMQSAGLVQLAPKDDPDLIIPLQLLYDRPILTNAPSQISLCSASAQWLANPQGDLPCVSIDCPDFGDQTRLCPAGFWGFRHAISITLVRKTDCGMNDLPTGIPVAAKPPVLVGLTTDPQVAPYLNAHITALKKIFDVTEKRDFSGLSTALQQSKANIVYLLCHLRYDGSVPVLVVGPENGPGIDAPILFDLAPDLCQGQPLVFMNACESAAASPDRILGLINHFFQYGASTAIGTEITVFTSLAVPFAERLLQEFADDVSIGESIRRARVAMLAARNPLGLAYVAFGLPQFALQVSV